MLKTLLKTSIICDLIFSEDATLVAIEIKDIAVSTDHKMKRTWHLEDFAVLPDNWVKIKALKNLTKTRTLPES